MFPQKGRGTVLSLQKGWHLAGLCSEVPTPHLSPPAPQPLLCPQQTWLQCQDSNSSSSFPICAQSPQCWAVLGFQGSAVVTPACQGYSHTQSTAQGSSCSPGVTCHEPRDPPVHELIVGVVCGSPFPVPCSSWCSWHSCRVRLVCAHGCPLLKLCRSVRNVSVKMLL